MLKYVCVELHNDNKLHEYYYKTIIRSALTRAKVDASDCQDIISYCDNNSFVVNLTAEAMDVDPTWVLDRPRFIKATSMMLEHKQPKQLRIAMIQSTPGQLLDVAKAIKVNFTGRLEVYLNHSESSLTACDDIVKGLVGAK